MSKTVALLSIALTISLFSNIWQYRERVKAERDILMAKILVFECINQLSPKPGDKPDPPGERL